MTDVHERFRAQLAAHLLEVLPGPEAAWMEAHAADCADCAALLERMRTQLPSLAEEAKHVPLSLLHQWVTSRGTLTALERELVERHIESCEACGADSAKLATAYGTKQPHVVVSHRSRAPLGMGLAAAALLAVIFAVNPWRQPSPPSRSQPEQPTPVDVGSAASPVAVTITMVERSRSASDGDTPVATLPDPGARLRLLLPPLFVDGTEDVEIRVARSDGVVVWQTRLAARALGDTLAPTAPAEGWSAGRYRVLVVPAAGRDTAAARTFGFRLLVPAER